LKADPRSCNVVLDVEFIRHKSADEPKVTISPLHIRHFDIPRFPEESFFVVGEELTFELLIIFVLFVSVVSSYRSSGVHANTHIILACVFMQHIPLLSVNGSFEIP
jgi:hypothetical protein